MIFNYKHAPNLVNTWRQEFMRTAPGLRTQTGHPETGDSRSQGRRNQANGCGKTGDSRPQFRKD